MELKCQHCLGVPQGLREIRVFQAAYILRAAYPLWEDPEDTPFPRTMTMRNMSMREEPGILEELCSRLCRSDTTVGAAATEQEQLNAVGSWGGKAWWWHSIAKDWWT